MENGTLARARLSNNSDQHACLCLEAEIIYTRLKLASIAQGSLLKFNFACCRPHSSLQLCITRLYKLVLFLKICVLNHTLGRLHLILDFSVHSERY